jgi:hypothetical protein
MQRSSVVSSRSVLLRHLGLGFSPEAGAPFLLAPADVRVFLPEGNEAPSINKSMNFEAADNLQLA